MTADQVLAALKLQLREAIESHEAHLKKINDTGTMWRASAYREVLKEIERLEALP